MKSQADKKRSFRTFEVGDQVFLKLQPYIQTSVAPRANHKLAYKYYGPFPIVAKINEAAYKLQLPPQATIHPVFHVSLLRRALNSGTSVETQLPHCTDELAVPMSIIQSRWRMSKGKMHEQVKVRWSNSDTLGDTWEDEATLQERFPLAEAWGQASFQGKGDVNDAGETDPPSSHSRGHVVPAQRATRARRPNPRVVGPTWAN